MLAGVASLALLGAGLSSAAFATGPYPTQPEGPQSGEEVPQLGGTSGAGTTPLDADDAGDPLLCTSGNVYAIGFDTWRGLVEGEMGGARGQMVHVAPDGAVTPVGPELPTAYDSVYTGTNTQYGWNGLGVSSDGSWAMVFQRMNNRDVRMWKYTASTDEWVDTQKTFVMHEPNKGFEDELASAIAGAICPACIGQGEQFVWGGYNNNASNSTRFQLWAFDPETEDNVYLGYIPVRKGNFDAGDITFDGKGNLYLAAGNLANDRMRLYTVTHESMMAAAGGAMVASESPERNFVKDVNGVALTQDGEIYVSAKKEVLETDLPLVTNPVTVTQELFTASTWQSSDLASCPKNIPTITVQKDVVGRANPDDQFALDLKVWTALKDENGNPLPEEWHPVADPITTAGTDTGIQAEKSGPWPTARGLKFQFSESAAEGSSSLSEFYETSWKCVTDGDPEWVAAGKTTSGELAYPSGSSITSVVCTFKNEPVTPNLEKTIRDGYPKQLKNGNWEIVYDVEVALPEDTKISAKYNLVDELNYGDGITIDSATWATEGATGGDFVNGAAEMATDKVITPTDGPHKYTVTVEAAVADSAFLEGTYECAAESNEEGSGFLNTATLTANGETQEKEACGEPELPEQSWVLKKDSDPKPGSTVKAGEKIKYTLTVTNTGVVPLKDAYAVDDASEVLKHATLNTPLPDGVTQSGTTLTWKVPNIKPGESAQVSYTVTVKDFKDSVAFKNVVTPEGPGGECEPNHCETNHKGGQLPKTGAAIGGVVALAMVLLLGGGYVTFAAKRKRGGEHTA